MLEALNKVVIRKEELVEFADECSKLGPRLRHFDGHALTAARLHPGDVPKITALMFRMHALSRLIDQGVPSGWTIHSPEGPVYAEQAVFAAAAVEPMVEQDGYIGFEPTTFFQKVLELAQAQPRIQ